MSTNKAVYVERIAHTNQRVTKGRLYLYINGKIKDDRGYPMSPSIQDEYWKIRHDIGVPEPAPPAARYEIPAARYEIPAARYEIPPAATLVPRESTSINSNLKETTMLNIKSTTLIDGTDADHFSVESLIELIKGEEVKLENLSVITSKSKAITKLKAKHESNIAKLVKILDDKEDV